MLCQNERGVLPGSEYFLPTVSDTARGFYYYTSICGHYRCETGYGIERDSAQSFLLMAVDQGALVVESDGQRTVVQPGQTALLDCYEPHRYTADGFLEFSWMHIAGVNSRELCRSITGGVSLLVTTQGFAEIKALMNQLLSRFRSRQRVSEPMCARTVYNLLCCLMPDAGLLSPTDGVDTPAGRAVAYIGAHLGEPLSLGVLAAHVQLSPYHFTRVFKKATGYSPYEYIILLRIDGAKQLLKNTSLSIKEIGARVGYATEISFINAFTQKVGISPGRFRRLPIG